MKVRLRLAAILLAAFTLVPVLQPGLDAQLPAAPDDSFAGLQWRFVRIKYHHMFESGRVTQVPCAIGRSRVPQEAPLESRSSTRCEQSATDCGSGSTAYAVPALVT